MNQNQFTSLRKSRMTLNEVYFWTNTIKDWKHLFEDDRYKRIIIEQLQWLKSHNKILVYCFVILPNHIHLIWEPLEMNGKEMPHASFNKWASSQFLKDLRKCHPEALSGFVEKTNERNHRFWQRDALAVLLDSREKMEQNIDYIHDNPLQESWNLAASPEEYRWSSAKFYLNGQDEFGILTDYRDRF